MQKYEDKMKKTRAESALKCTILLGVSILLVGVLYNLIPTINSTEKEQIVQNEIKQLPFLEDLLTNLTQNTNIENGVCLTYTLYYKDYLIKNYPELDVRKIDMAGVCPIGTIECGEWEGMPHTYLIVNGHGEECILDQKMFTCINLRWIKIYY